MADSNWTETFDVGEDLYSEEFGGDGDSAEFVLPMAGLAAARQLLRRSPRKPLPAPTGRGYVPPPPTLRAVPATQQQLGVATSRIGEDVRKTGTALKTLEGRLDTYSGQLAALQQKKAGEQSANLFQYASTKAAGEIATSLFRGDWGQAITQGLPWVQTMVSGRGGAASSFSTMPWSTFGFPLVGLAAVWLLRKPETPRIIPMGTAVLIDTPMILGGKTYFIKDKVGTTEPNIAYAGPIPVVAGDKIRAKTVTALGLGSDTAAFDVP